MRPGTCPAAGEVRVYRIIIVLGAVLGLLMGAGPAFAEPPAELSGQLTDAADVLDADEETQVNEVLADLVAAGGPDLYVVLVSDLDGSSNGAWAEQTAALTDLGSENMLFAVGVDDAEYEWWVDPDSALPVADVNEVVTDQVAPQVVDSNWTAALVALAGALQDEPFLVNEEEPAAPVDPDADDGAWSMTTVAIVVGIGAIVLLGAHQLSRRRDASRHRADSGRSSLASRP